MTMLTQRLMRPFDPRGIPGLAVFLDAQNLDSITLNGTTASAWKNRGTKGVPDALQATALRQPLYVASAVKSRPALQGRHDGTNASQLSIADNTGLDYTQYTYFVTGQRVTDSGAQEMLAGKYDNTTNQRESRIYIGSTDSMSTARSSDGTATVAAGTPVSSVLVGTPFIGASSYDNVNLAVKVNNQSEALAAASGMFNGTAAFTLFSLPSFGEPYMGYIGAVLFYTNAVSANNQKKVGWHLMQKYGGS